jgi:hypothetical protein
MRLHHWRASCAGLVAMMGSHVRVDPNVRSHLCGVRAQVIILNECPRGGYVKRSIVRALLALTIVFSSVSLLQLPALAENGDSLSFFPAAKTVEHDTLAPLQYATVTTTSGYQYSVDPRSMVWSSSDPSIATIASSSTVSAHGIGNSVMTAAYNGLTASYTLLVREMTRVSPPQIAGTHHRRGWIFKGHARTVLTVTSTGQPLPNQTVTFTYTLGDGVTEVTYCAATTDASGIADCVGHRTRPAVQFTATHADGGYYSESHFTFLQ